MYSQTCFSPKLNVLRNIFIILIHYTKAMFMCVQNNHLSKFFVAHKTNSKKIVIFSCKHYWKISFQRMLLSVLEWISGFTPLG